MLHVLDPEDDLSSYRANLAGLFCGALGQEATYAQAMEVLCSWLERVEQNSRYERQMLAVLQDITSRCDPENRTLERIKIYLGRWADRPRGPLEVAQRALAHLEL